MNPHLKSILLLLLCTIITLSNDLLFAQSGNPFEIVGRKSNLSSSRSNISTTIIDTPTIVDTTISPIIATNDTIQSSLVDSAVVYVDNIQESIAPDANNPFEIIKSSNINVSPSLDPVQKKKTTLSETAPVKNNSNISNILFWILTGILIALAFYLTIFRNHLHKVYRSFLNHNILRLSHREQRSLVDFPYLILYFLFFINLSIFIFLASSKLMPGFNQLNSSFLFKIFGAIIGLYFAKHLILNALDFIFKINPEMGLYNFMIMTFNNMLGIFLVPLNIGIAFSSPGIAKMLVFAGLSVFSLVLLFRSIRGILLGYKLISFHKFHFFMYLCAIEFIPAVILVKYIMLQNGIQ